MLALQEPPTVHQAYITMTAVKPTGQHVAQVETDAAASQFAQQQRQIAIDEELTTQLAATRKRGNIGITI